MSTVIDLATITSETPNIHVVKAPLWLWQACGDYDWIVGHSPSQIFQISYQTRRWAAIQARRLNAMAEDMVVDGVTPLADQQNSANAVRNAEITTSRTTPEELEHSA